MRRSSGLAHGARVPRWAGSFNYAAPRDRDAPVRGCYVIAAPVRPVPPRTSPQALPGRASARLDKCYCRVTDAAIRHTSPSGKVVSQHRLPGIFDQYNEGGARGREALGVSICMVSTQSHQLPLHTALQRTRQAAKDGVPISQSCRRLHQHQRDSSMRPLGANLPSADIENTGAAHRYVGFLPTGASPSWTEVLFQQRGAILATGCQRGSSYAYNFGKRNVRSLLSRERSPQIQYLFTVLHAFTYNTPSCLYSYKAHMISV